MIKYLDTRRTPLTRELAEDFATMPKVPGERRHNKKREAYLQQKFDEGLFYAPRWCRALHQGVWHRINGQHSSLMLAKLNGNFPKHLNVMVDEWACDTMDDMAMLFGQYDRPESSRTMGDILNANKSINPTVANIRLRHVQQITAGISFYLINYEKNKTVQQQDIDNRSRLVHEYAEFIAWCSPLASHRVLDRVPVFAAIFGTYKRDPDAAMEFWSNVGGNSHESKTHPSSGLHLFLLQLSGSGKSRNDNAERTWSSIAIFTKCIHAWNAAREGRVFNLGVGGLKYYATAKKLPSIK